MAGKFVMTRDKSGQYRVVLKAGNGEVLAVDNGGYAARASAFNMIESVRRLAADAELVDES